MTDSYWIGLSICCAFGWGWQFRRTERARAHSIALEQIITRQARVIELADVTVAILGERLGYDRMPSSRQAYENFEKKQAKH